MSLFRRSAAAFALILLSATSAWATRLFWENEPTAVLADRLLAAMSDEEIVAQVFMVGYAGQRPTPELLAWIRQRNIGSVKVFGWNTDDLGVLGASIAHMQRQALATRHGIPLFISTDQEGGWVRHVRGDTSITPGNMAIGASRLPYDAFRTGLHIGKELRALGINMNLAPTVDVYINPEAHVIGPRAFGSDPVLSGILGIAYHRGMQKAGVISVAKHFPGHGNAVGDSHSVLPRIMDDYQSLWERDLVPFRMLIAEGIPAIMSGHLSFPAVAGNDIPASLNPYFGRTLLRDVMGFEGLLITDDLYMGGALAHDSNIARVSLQALKAGSDMIMLSRTPALNDEIWRTIYAEYRGNEAFRRDIRASVRRILVKKLDYFRAEGSVPLIPDPQAIVAIPSEESRAFFFSQASRAATLVKAGGLIPYHPAPSERVLLAGQLRGFFVAGRARFPQADEFRFSYNPFATSIRSEREAFRRLVDEYDTVIFCLSNPNSLEVLKAAQGTRARIIVLSILTPVYLQEVPWVHAAVAVYGFGIESYQAGFAVIRGDFVPQGRLPINLPRN